MTITSSRIISQPNATCSQLSTIVSSTIDSLSTLQGLFKFRSRCHIYILLLGSVKHIKVTYSDVTQLTPYQLCNVCLDLGQDVAFVKVTCSYV